MTAVESSVMTVSYTLFGRTHDYSPSKVDLFENVQSVFAHTLGFDAHSPDTLCTDKGRLCTFYAGSCRFGFGLSATTH